MLGFSPFKKHANKFNYVPRYYDPEKEAREERRAEMRGERAEDADRPYRPGQYIRTQREARAARIERENQDRSRSRMFKIVLGIVVAVIVIYILLPRIADVFSRAADNRPAQPAVQTEAEFDPYAPITIVPNDYKEEE